MENYLSGALIGIMMTYLFWVSRKPAQRDSDDNLILKLPKLYTMFGALIILAGITCFVYAIGFASDNDQILSGIVSVFVVGFGYIIFAKGYISNICVSDEGVSETTIFGKKKLIKWGDMTKVKFGKISLELKMSDSHKSIKAHMHTIGFNELVDKIELKTGITRLNMGVPS